MSGSPQDDMVSYLDGILQELVTGDGAIGLVRIQDEGYREKIEQLNQMWRGVQTGIKEVRGGASQKQLLSVSEDYFKLANDAVFAAEIYSNKQTHILSFMILAMAAAMAMTWLFILRIYIKKLLNMEDKNQDLIDKVFQDALTGAPNLEKFRLDAQVQLDKKAPLSFAIFNVDIDNFKYYNDVFGTQYGDEILKKYAEIIREDMASQEFFCRVSSDNFLILRQYTNKTELTFRQEKIDKQIAQYVLDTKGQHSFVLSCGICCMEGKLETQTIGNLIEQANFARKTVKNHPFNQYAFYNASIRDKMLSEKDIENRMHQALENKEFIVYMQPKVSLKTNKITSAEALVRWAIPGERIVPPDAFIPVFEKNMFIASLDRYVFEEVCKWMRKRLDEEQSVVAISVNVSRMQLYDPEFVESYTRIKDKYHIPTNMLEIEFTESMVFENLEVLLHIIASLKQAGFLCSLDDFGKGYSSLNLLRKLPVDVLKLDKLFFDEDEHPERAHTVITGVVAMGKQLNMEIVAEGVEKKEQVQFLHRIGCEMVQGYIFYRPMPIKKLEETLAKEADVL